MRYIISPLPVLCIILLILVLAVEPVTCFGAGAIPNYAYLNEKAYRHGDIAEVLPRLVKHAGDGGVLGAIVAFFWGGDKFSKMDMKRIYFGNWLRDYSQAMDVAGLSKITSHTLNIIVAVLGFMTFGFATAEFEITPERLGVYLPVEHMDNPKGYAKEEGDARKIHPKLRPPVDPRELEVDPKNGMKNYIATEGQSWDTSTAHVRRTLQECIALGRKARGRENEDQFEAFRLLGSALHTLEDLLAHSNWCELGLRKLGHKDVFCHVGDAVLIDTPNGPAPPLVTGTFGSADFIHSVLGEGIDRLSEATVTNLAQKIDEAKNKLQSDDHISFIRTLLHKLPIFVNTHHDEKMDQAESIKQKAFDFNPDDVAPEAVQEMLWHVLEWRDVLYKDVLKVINMVPGLNELFDELAEALNAFVFTILDPILKPILQDVADQLQESSKAVIDTDDQYEVFENPHASDPSHSMLAKDHFGLILNEPAGKIAQVVVEHSVNLIVKAWSDEHADINGIIDKILETIHHPYFSTGNSDIQRQMMEHLEKWLAGLSPEDSAETLQALTKDSVREGKNKRIVKEVKVEVEEDTPVLVQVPLPEEQPEEVKEPSVKTATADRGIRYEVQPGLPVFSRFDGKYPRPRPRNPRDRPHAVKTDEEFWRNPYAKDSPEYGYPTIARPTGHTSYAGHHARAYITAPTAHDSPLFDPSHVLREAESGYLAGISETRRRDAKRQQRQSWSDADEWEFPMNRYSYEELSRGGWHPRVCSNNDVNDGPNFEGGPRHARTRSAFKRYDSNARGSMPYSDQSDAPPAFFVRGQYPFPEEDFGGYNYARDTNYSTGRDGKQPGYGDDKYGTYGTTGTEAPPDEKTG